MDRLTLYRHLQETETPVHTTEQIAEIMGVSPASASVTLHRLVKDGVLVRVIRGHFCLPNTNILAVASGLYERSYVTLLAALEYHGVTTQTPRVIDVLNPVHSGMINVILENGRFLIRFIKVRPKLIFGYEKVRLDGAIAHVAEMERVAVDGLLLPEYLPLDETLDCIREDRFDGKKAQRYAKRTGRPVVMKRLGYLMTREGKEIPSRKGHISDLSRTYIPLDPKYPRRGPHDPLWRVIDNTVIGWKGRS